jgi:hypothetical protein
MKNAHQLRHMLSQHNAWTNEWRKTEKDKMTDDRDEKPQFFLALTSINLQSKTPLIPRTHASPKTTGAKIVNSRTLLADQAQTLWVIGTGAKTITTAMTNSGLEPLII